MDHRKNPHQSIYSGCQKYESSKFSVDIFCILYYIFILYHNIIIIIIMEILFNVFLFSKYTIVNLSCLR